MRSPQTTGRSAFTLVELCVIVALVFVLSLLLLPALAGARTNAKSVQCLNNLRRLTGAWQMYTGDNLDSLPSKLVGGSMDWGTNPDNTNSALFADSSLSQIAPYLRGADLFKCPADNYLSLVQRSLEFSQRVRSVSLSASLAGFPTIITPGVAGRTYFTAKKLTELNKPGPANTFVILDEHPDGIDDAQFHLNLGLSLANASWRSFPAGHHEAGAGVSFADGHVIIKRWQDPRTLLPVRFFAITPLPMPSPGNVDYVWLNGRAPYR